jgi:hypothetical protein
MYKNIILPVVLYGFEKGLSHKEKNKNWGVWEESADQNACT